MRDDEDTRQYSRARLPVALAALATLALGCLDAPLDPESDAGTTWDDSGAGGAWTAPDAAGGGWVDALAATDAGTLEEPHLWPENPYGGGYAGIESLTGDALVQAICNLVATGYESISYSQARTVVLEHIDNHEGQVRTVYEGLWHSSDSHSDVNIEHTWPQSKGAEGIAKSDMHHLFPERSTFNSARSNYTFGEVVTRTWPSTLLGDSECAERLSGDATACFSVRGTDRYGVTVFEPRDGHKGDTARAIFYFSLRYGVACDVKPLSVLDPEHPDVTEAVLKHWNYVDPPDDHERRRNDLVEHTQNVRNPFIDHPELVDEISFH